MDRLLQKSDELSDSLAKLQLQFEKTQNQAQEQLNNAKDEAYKEGYNQAKEEIKTEIQDELNAQKKVLVDSIITLENALKDSQTHLQNLEKELSAIAVDIAKEVIVKEIEENSQSRTCPCQRTFTLYYRCYGYYTQGQSARLSIS